MPKIFSKHLKVTGGCDLFTVLIGESHSASKSELVRLSKAGMRASWICALGTRESLLSLLTKLMAKMVLGTSSLLVSNQHVAVIDSLILNL